MGLSSPCYGRRLYSCALKTTRLTMEKPRGRQQHATGAVSGTHAGPTVERPHDPPVDGPRRRSRRRFRGPSCFGAQTLVGRAFAARAISRSTRHGSRAPWFAGGRTLTKSRGAMAAMGHQKTNVRPNSDVRSLIY